MGCHQEMEGLPPNWGGLLIGILVLHFQPLTYVSDPESLEVLIPV